MNTTIGLTFTILYIGNTAAIFDNIIPPGIFPADYDKYDPPWKKGYPAHVYLRMTIMDVDQIDDGAMEFSVMSYLMEYWNDTRLNFSKILETTVIEAVIPTHITEHIWVPDIVFDNTKNGMMFHLSLPNRCVQILEDGTLVRTTRYNLLVGCMMDFSMYPMDTQHCFIKISSFLNPDYKVVLHWHEEHHEDERKSIILIYNIQPLKYVLLQPETHKVTEIWPDANFTFLFANFTFVRRFSGNFFNVYIPSMLVVFLSWISFWLDVEAVPARVTLGVTTLLTLVTQIVQAHSNLPAISYMTAMDVWLFACLTTVFSSLLEFAFSYQQHLLNKEIHLPEREEFSRMNLRPNIRIGTAPDMILTSKPNSGVSYQSKRYSRRKFLVSAKFSKVKKKLKPGKSLDKISRKLFPSVFFAFSAIYWSYYLTWK